MKTKQHTPIGIGTHTGCEWLDCRCTCSSCTLKISGFADFNELCARWSVDEMARYLERTIPQLHPCSSHGANRIFIELIKLAKGGESIKNIKSETYAELFPCEPFETNET